MSDIPRKGYYPPYSVGDIAYFSFKNSIRVYPYKFVGTHRADHWSRDGFGNSVLTHHIMAEFEADGDHIPLFISFKIPKEYSPCSIHYKVPRMWIWFRTVFLS